MLLRLVYLWCVNRIRNRKLRNQRSWIVQITRIFLILPNLKFSFLLSFLLFGFWQFILEKLIKWQIIFWICEAIIGICVAQIRDHFRALSTSTRDWSSKFWWCKQVVISSKLLLLRSIETRIDFDIIPVIIGVFIIPIIDTFLTNFLIFQIDCLLNRVLVLLWYRNLIIILYLFKKLALFIHEWIFCLINSFMNQLSHLMSVLKFFNFFVLMMERVLTRLMRDIKFFLFILYFRFDSWTQTSIKRLLSFNNNIFFSIWI